MLLAAPILLALSSATAPGSADLLCSTAERTSLIAEQTWRLSTEGFAVPLVHAPAPTLVGVTAPRLRLTLGVPRLSLGWLKEFRVSITLSVAWWVGGGCAWQPSLAVDMPSVALLEAAHVSLPTVALRYRPMVTLSLLAPWMGLLARLGEPMDAHARLQVGVYSGVGFTGQGTPGGVLAAPAQGRMTSYPGVAARPPSFTVPSVGAPPVVVPSIRRGGSFTHR